MADMRLRVRPPFPAKRSLSCLHCIRTCQLVSSSFPNSFRGNAGVFANMGTGEENPT